GRSREPGPPELSTALPAGNKRCIRSSAGSLHQQWPCRSVTVRFQGLYGTVGTNTPWQAQPPSGDRAGHALRCRDFAFSSWRSAALALVGRGPLARLGANLRRKMRRAIAVLVVGLLGPGLAATAAAGTFGGF